MAVAKELATEVKLEPKNTPIDTFRYTTYPTTMILIPAADCVLNFRENSYKMKAKQKATITADGVVVK